MNKQLQLLSKILKTVSTMINTTCLLTLVLYWWRLAVQGGKFPPPVRGWGVQENATVLCLWEDQVNVTKSQWWTSSVPPPPRHHQAINNDPVPDNYPVPWCEWSGELGWIQINAKVTSLELSFPYVTTFPRFADRFPKQEETCWILLPNVDRLFQR